MAGADRAVVSRDSLFAEGENLLGLYRRGVEGCRTRNEDQVGRVLMDLIGTLNFNYEEAATRLFKVYDDCLLRVRRRQFEIPRRVLQSLEAALEPAAPRWREGR